MNRATALPHSLPRPWRLVGGLMLLLVCAHLLWQSLGQVHRTVHAPRLAALHGHDHHHDHAAEAHLHSGHGDHADHQHTLADSLAALFSSHGDVAECRLIDQCGQADGLPTVPSLALPVLLSSFALHVFTGQVTARWAALFDARGPPSLR